MGSVKRVTLEDILNDTGPDQPESPHGDLVVWAGQPGGSVVDRFEENGISYAWVEFEKSPGEKYLYLVR